MNSLFFILLAIVLLHSDATVTAQETKIISGKEYRLFWQDDFTSLEESKTKWNYRALGKRGDAYNSTSAISLDGNGNLVIEIRKKGDSILTGMIDTERKFETRYGYFECRAKLSNVAGAWPGFWLQSSMNHDNGVPETHGAEIDIFEYFPNLKKDSVSHTLHWGGYGASHKMAGPIFAPLKQTSDGYHTFALEWTAEGYTTFVDGVKTYSGNTLVSKVREFIVLSLEVNRKVAGPLNVNGLPDKFIVDYVKVYKLRE